MSAEMGIKKAIDNAEMKEPGWGDKAIELVRQYPYQRFMTEDVRAWAYTQGLPTPPHGRAWGWVIKMAAKIGIVEHDGFGLVANPKAHRTPASIWKKKRVTGGNDV